MSFNTLIDAASLRALPASPVLLDCRFDLADAGGGERAFRAGHIPGAWYADLDRDLAGPVTAQSGRHPLPDPARLAAFCRARGAGPGTQVVLYDEANGMFAARGWWLLRWLGLDAVAVLDGGLRSWLATGGALESGAVEPPNPSAPARAAPPPVRAQWTATTDEVLRQLGRGDSLVVDARAPDRFAGRVEPLDSVAGHVPGAVNHPFGDNLDADGKFLPAGELRRRWTTRLANHDPAAVIAMCGSGVTACHNLLALAIAQMPGARLYAGSWSEWIRDPDRPVAREPTP